MSARILVGGALGPEAGSLARWLHQQYFTVATAAGELALVERAREWRPDAAVLDAPSGEAALSLMSRLRVEPASRSMPVVLLCGDADASARVRGLDLGAADVLSGPLDYPLLLPRLRVVLQRAGRDGLPEGRDAAATSSVAGARALVVDDDPASAATVQAALLRDGVTTGCAATVAQAGALAGAMAFDLLVVNLALLSDDPLRAVADLRAGAPTRQLPMLLLVPVALRPTLPRCVDLGATDWLFADQPDATAELRARARAGLRRKFQDDRMRAELAAATEIALTDPLTGCYNRRYLLQSLQASLAAGSVSLLVLEVDSFDALTERLGFSAADTVLNELCRALRQSLRSQDSLARLGGAEFAVIMPGLPLEQANAAGLLLQQRTGQLMLQTVPGEVLAPAISVGAASNAGAPPPTLTTPEQLLRAARRHLDAVRASRQPERSVDRDIAPAPSPAAAVSLGSSI